MKGLLIKDLTLIRHQMKTLLLFAGIAVIMSCTMDTIAALFYMMFFGTTMLIGTLSYDEADNGLPFLFTLPFSRRDYAREKFLLCGGGMILCMGAGFLVSFICAMIKGPAAVSELLLEAPAGMAGMFFSLSVYISLMIPVRVKYGSEKGRMVLYVILIAAAALFFAISGLVGQPAVLDSSPGLNGGIIGAVFAAAGIIVMVIGEKITERILEKKEF